ncbi:hypothetical protein ACFW3E_13940, partial [Streptomyces sp. NPDC058861]
MTTTDRTGPASSEVESTAAAPTITDVIPSLAIANPETESISEPQGEEGDGKQKWYSSASNAPRASSDPPTEKVAREDWWDPLYYHQDADLDTNTGTIKTPLTRRLSVPTSPGERPIPEGEGREGEGSQVDGETPPIPGRTPPRPVFPPRSPAAVRPQVDPEAESTGSEEWSAAEQMNALLKKAVSEALDERAAEAGQDDEEEDPPPGGRWSKLRPRTHRKAPAPTPPPAGRARRRAPPRGAGGRGARAAAARPRGGGAG